MTSAPLATTTGAACYRRGDLVTVRSLEEILATLDVDGCLEGLPFMPEMARYCGATLRVVRRALRTCVEGSGMRAMDHAVLLDGVRCSGTSHDGCQRRCLMFWKEAWLMPASATAETVVAEVPEPCVSLTQLPTRRGDKYLCQSTALAAATRELPNAEIRYYWHDFRIGETSLPRLLHVIWVQLVNKIWQHLWRVDYFCQPAGERKKTESVTLNLHRGELVQVRSLAEIKATLDTQGRNRGLRFESEMARYCGRQFRVFGPMRQAIAEKTGKMIELSNTVTLEGLTCAGICARNCPRANYFWWREIWLQRVEIPSVDPAAVFRPTEPVVSHTPAE